MRKSTCDWHRESPSISAIVHYLLIYHVLVYLSSFGSATVAAMEPMFLLRVLHSPSTCRTDEDKNNCVCPRSMTHTVDSRRENWSHFRLSLSLFCSELYRTVDLTRLVSIVQVVQAGVDIHHELSVRKFRSQRVQDARFSPQTKNINSRTHFYTRSRDRLVTDCHQENCSSWINWYH